MVEPGKDPDILLIKTTYVRSLIDMLSKVEPNIHPCITQAGLPENILTTPHPYIPEVPVRNLIAIIVQKSDTQQYQALCWQICKQVYIPSNIAQLNQATTVEEALLAFIELMKTDSPYSKISLQQALGKTWFTRYKKKTAKHESWYEASEQFSLIYMIELIRALSDSAWVPEQVSLQSENAQPFYTLLNDAGIKKTKIFTGRSFTAVDVSEQILKRPFSAKLIWNDDLTIVNQPQNFIDYLKAALPVYLLAGKLPIAKASEVLGLSVRTLQRRLKEHDVSFRQILDEIQIKEAKTLLKNSTHPITTISTHLGYSNVAHFSRAFKRVTGISPSYYRQGN